MSERVERWFDMAGKVVVLTGGTGRLGRHYGDGGKLDAAAIETIAAPWRPWRSVATWYLWRSLDPIPVAY